MAEHGLDGLVYGHFGDGCVHVRIDFPLADAPRPLPRRSSSTRPSWSAGTAGRCPASTATAGPAASCCRTCTRPRRSTRSAAVKAIFDPANLLNPGVLVDPAPLDADLRLPQAARRCATGLGFAYPHDGGDLTTAVHRCVGVGKCRADTTATGGVMCPSYLATRDEKDSTRGRARVLQELANGTLVRRLRRRPRWTSRSTCACPARAARRTARPAWTWPPTRPRCCTSATGAGCARRRTTRWAGCRAGPGWPRARRGWPTPRCAARRWPRWPSGPAASTPRRPLPRFAAQTFRRLVRPAARAGARPAGTPGAAVGRHVHRPLHARGRPGRGARCSRPPATRCRSPTSRCAAG